MDNRPIGFLDSGVGGLTVVRELLRQLPHEDVVYIGDSARAPYGPRPADQIREYTWQMVNFLLTKNVKMIVLACNTATAVVWEEVKEKLVPYLSERFEGLGVEMCFVMLTNIVKEDTELASVRRQKMWHAVHSSCHRTWNISF